MSDLPENNEFRLAVLASGTGSNLQAIIDSVHGRDEIVLACVVSDKASCRALDRAVDAGIKTASFTNDGYAGDRARRDRAMADYLREQRIDLIVLAGYMQVLSTEFIDAFRGQIINVHPSLLPAFPGLRAIWRALEAGVAETGVTIHFVDEGIDTGPVIAQQTLRITPSDTVDTLAVRVHGVEHQLLPAAIQKLAAARRG